MATPIELAVLGPFEVRVDGEDITRQLSPTQRVLLALLAAAGGPVDKLDAGRAAGFAPSSIDPQLSRVRRLLRASRPVHDSGVGRSGTLALAAEVASTDVGQFHRLLAEGDQARRDGHDDAALRAYLAADRLWRGPVLDGVSPVSDRAATRLVASLVGPLEDARRRGVEQAVRCWFDGIRGGLDAERLVAWAETLRDSSVCWHAATLAVLERTGVHDARAVLQRWRECASVYGDAAVTSRYADAVQRLDEIEPGPVRVLPPIVAHLMERAETARHEGRWDDAERNYRGAADEARIAGDLSAEAEATLAMARLNWDPEQYGQDVAPRLTRLLEALQPGDRTLRARLLAGLVGGVYQDGSVEPARARAHAYEALELAGGIDDPLTAAEVLAHARTALVDVDTPHVQLQRARWIIRQAGRSDYHRALGLMAAIVDSLLLDRVAEARVDSEAYRELAARSRSHVHGFNRAALDGMWALVDGRYDEVERTTSEAHELGGGFGGMSALQVVESQRLWSAYERRDLDELERRWPVIEYAATHLPGAVPVWRVCAALGASVLGRHDDAWARIREVAAATAGFTTVPRGPLRIGALALGALVCADLAATGRDVGAIARGVQTALDAHDATGVMVGWPALYLGHKQRYIDLASDAARACGA